MRGSPRCLPAVDQWYGRHRQALLAPLTSPLAPLEAHSARRSFEDGKPVGNPAGGCLGNALPPVERRPAPVHAVLAAADCSALGGHAPRRDTTASLRPSASPPLLTAHPSSGSVGPIAEMLAGRPTARTFRTRGSGDGLPGGVPAALPRGHRGVHRLPRCLPSGLPLYSGECIGCRGACRGVCQRRHRRVHRLPRCVPRPVHWWIGPDPVAVAAATAGARSRR